MPPKTRGSKTSKALKENIGVVSKTKSNITSKVIKSPRKALADKTNSASDDNATFLQLKTGLNVCDGDNLLIKQRPHRDRRLPNRFIENTGLKNSLKSKQASVENKSKPKSTPVKSIPQVILTPLKTPKLSLDTSLTVRRPKRICRLPSKFDDHSISPSKYVPVQPAYASTPKILKKPNQTENKPANKVVNPTKTTASDKVLLNKAKSKRTVNKKLNDTSNTNSPNSSADTNNNAKPNQLPHSKTKNKEDTSPKASKPNPKLLKMSVDKNHSIRILEDKKKSLKRDASNIDVYEFTYDPNEEPPPQKKKRKKPTKKREPKPKKVVFKDNYDKNLAKALIALKNTISEKSGKPIAKDDNVKVLATSTYTAHPDTETVVTTFRSQPLPSSPYAPDKSHTSIKNYNSVRVEDIALDFEQDNCDDINYSPVHSLCEPTPVRHDIPGSETPGANNLNNTPGPQNNMSNLPKPNDPLSLREHLSFFDDQPVASSSMNMSVRNPAASPWRVEFGSLPIKWQVNTYVKPNMTPAFESSFMNFNESKKKHVYTNMVTDTNEENDLPQIYDDYASKLKQTSIISFIKEVVEKNAKKKREKMTPIKANSLFEDLNNTSVSAVPLAQNEHITPKKNVLTNVQSNDQSTSSASNISSENAHSDNSKKIANENKTAKGPIKKKRDKNITYFGFDHSENHDQENVSPVKKIDKRRLRALKPRSRAVLQEINEQKGPTRAMLPVAVKSKPTQSSQTSNKLFDEMKSATEPPVFPEKDPINSTEATNITEAQNNSDSNDDQSVHLFEDVAVVHNVKAHRKSYGKSKKAVTFHRNSASDSDVPNDTAEQSASSDEDDLHDLTFKVPAIEQKKTIRKRKPKKTKISKKQEQEVEAWAAGFNSMCEDIEEFNLVVE